MRLLWIAALVVGTASGCLTAQDGDGIHLVAHITSPIEFDHMVVTLDNFNPLNISLGDSATSYDFDHWEIADEISDIKVTLMANGNPVASGEASHIQYHSAGDGSELAEITMPLQP